MKDYLEVAQDVFRQRDRYQARRKFRSGFFWCLRKMLLIGMLLVTVGFISVITYLFAVSYGLRQDDYRVFDRIPGIHLEDNLRKNSDQPSASIDQPLYRDGLRITLKQAVRDGSRISMLLNLESTEDFPLEACSTHKNQHQSSIQFKKIRLEDSQGDSLWLVRPSLKTLPDLDGRQNTLLLAIGYDLSSVEGNREFQLEEGKNTVLSLQDLRFLDARNELESKNETLDGYHIIAGGEWKFEFPFSFVRSSEQELLEEPASMTCYLSSGDQVDAEVFSVKINPLGLRIGCRLPASITPAAGNFGVIKCVLTDESEIYMKPETGLSPVPWATQPGSGQTVYQGTYRFDPPFLADRITRLYLSGMQLMPEEEP